MSLTIEQQMLVEQRLSNEKKSTGLAYVLWFFLPAFGAHRFYLGKIGSGIAQLLLWWGGILLSVIGVGLILIAVAGVWWIVDAFLITGMVEEDARAKRIQIANEIAAIARN